MKMSFQYEAYVVYFFIYRCDTIFITYDFVRILHSRITNIKMGKFLWSSDMKIVYELLAFGKSRKFSSLERAHLH